MTSKTHAAIQLILAAATSLSAADLTGYIHFLPPKYAALATAVMAALQGILGWYNHYYNPDGTPVSVPYVPPQK